MENNQMLAELRQNQNHNPALNVGAVSIEQERATAETRAQIQLAKMFPRNMNTAHAELMEACANKAFASDAFYSVPRGGGSVTGPSIRFAEEVARVYGHMEYGHREYSRSEGKSEVEVYAWDKQNNNRSIRQITVMHIIDTRQGPKPCKSQKEIDDLVANIASKQLRGRILALMPKWFVADALERCKKTLLGDNEKPVSARVRDMVQAFSKFGVNAGHIEGYLGHKLETTMLDELIELTGVYNSLKEGRPAAEFFSQEAIEQMADAPAINAIAQAAAAAQSANQDAQATQAAPVTTRRRTAKPEPVVEQVAQQEAPEAQQQSVTTATQQDSNAVQRHSNKVEEPQPVNQAEVPVTAAPEVESPVQADSSAEQDDGDVF
jgi:hypothetical protein